MSDAKDNPDEATMDELARRLIDQLGSAEAVLQHLGVLGADDAFAMPPRPQPELLSRRASRAAYVVRVDLNGAEPPIWRRLRLASDMSLPRLHDVVQIVMGWMDSHLHHFQMGPDQEDFRMTPFLTHFDEMEGETDGLFERDVRLDETIAEPGQRLFYEYDFGDSWQHTITLEKVEPWDDDAPEVTCLTGRRACPPEDVGGIGGYEEAVSAWRGESGENPEWFQQIRDWLPVDFDPERFDTDEINEQLSRGPGDLTLWHPKLAEFQARTSVLSPVNDLIVAATNEPVELTITEHEEATRRYRHLLTTIRDGVKLTQAGYLPPALVKQLFAELNLGDDDWPFPPSREDATLPVLMLRESAIALGLLRKQHGRLLPTAAGKRLAGNPSEMFAHIRGRLPLGRRDFEQDAGLLALLYAAVGKSLLMQDDEAADLFSMLGWRAADGGELRWVLLRASDATRQVLASVCAGSADEGRRVAGALLRR